MLNFFFAIPEMVGILINGIGLLFNNAVPAYILASIEGLLSALVIVTYFLGLMNLLVSIRSQGARLL
jgi:hypothetical protein